MVPLPQRRQRLEHEERRRQILLCAQRLFSERSYDSVSTAEIAHAAGVARGLLHHYFGTKRELYLEVVRTLMRMPSGPVPPRARPRDLEALIETSVARWLRLLERNRGTWLAAVGTQGLGRDPEVAEILSQARERTAARLVAALGGGDPDSAPPELWAAVRSWGGMAEAASLEWLQRGRLTREQAHLLLVRSFMALAGEVVPQLLG